MAANSQGRVTAVLGPTNTGKTYLAIERMLAHHSGIIGFPLRLLARENYDRAARLKGRGLVALVTGEEKIVPPRARYFFCTVESMPLDRDVEFLAIDEVQLCADPERGHVFTDRLLHARGSEETMLLGAETIRPVLHKLVPEAAQITRPRFSTLSYRGARNITRLPPRSAVIAFSAAEVYVIAELMRRQRGGTAVVLGALSPRTRNAQVAMFEAGEVDYLVATDAIGMGLNLNLDHVAFNRLDKFDGRMPRRLTAAEVAQIAGRAGRHMNDGSFGVTGGLAGMDPELVEAVEQHRFDPLRFVYWRSRRLDLRTPHDLLKSLERHPPAAELVRARDAEDHLALSALVRDPEIERLAAHPEAVALLWEVCGIPDFRKILFEQHRGFLRRVYLYLMTGSQRLPTDWVARQIDRIDRYDGDIDALVTRISHVRTWTYVAHRGEWLDDAAHWRDRARAIEDKLSDALHQRLTQRFVDRRTAVLIRRLEAGERLLSVVKKSGEVLVEGEYVGQLEGFRFLLDKTADKDEAKALLSAARRALALEIPARLRTLEQEPESAFALDRSGRIVWRGATVARLGTGPSALRPQVVPLASELLESAERERLRKALGRWLEHHLRGKLRGLYRLSEADLSGPARGLAYQIVERLGTLPRGPVAGQLRTLSKAERKSLTDLGVRLGAASLYLPALMKSRSAQLRAILWAVHADVPVPPLPASADIAYRPERQIDGAWPAAFTDSFALAIGFRRLARDGDLVVIRADALERVAGEARKLAAQGAFIVTPALRRLAGLDEAAVAVVLAALGYLPQEDAGGVAYLSRGAARQRAKTRAGPPKPKRGRTGHRRDADSPFAKLSELKILS